MKKIELNSAMPRFTGEYRIITLKAKPKWISVKTWLCLYNKGLLRMWVKRVSPVIKNKVVFNTDHGVHLIVRQLAGDTTYPIELELAAIGTGSTAPTDADTDLETPVVTDIIRATIGYDLTSVDTEWFMIDSELPDGTYNEFALYCGTQMFCRSIINPAHTKASNEDTLVQYTINAGNDYTPSP